ncbi:MAG: exodeoxyribonuclease VII large subunit [Methanolinea sp.]|nr:exodeoxyribonuclease VII large subunit [Methanolinea sp.]
MASAPWYPRTTTQAEPRGIHSVSEISSLIESLLDDPRLQDIWIRGEITNYKNHTSGHRYFSLGERNGERNALISCVIWRSDAARLSFELADGMDVLAFGSVGHYAPQGRYQFYIKEILPAGRGEKYLVVEQWKAQLQQEGCFDIARKRPLPQFPARVGIVTSETGAVIHDIRNIIARRYPTELIVSPTAVQGDTAHIEIARAIRRLAGLVEVIIIARGGGSFEDLFPFNHPDVVRAIASSPVPVVSAIGHEVDVTLADHAADVRAPTPSAAAELVVPDRVKILEDLGAMRKILAGRLLAKLDRAASDLADLRERLSPRRMGQRLTLRREDLSVLEARMRRAQDVRIAREKERLAAFRSILEARNPLHLLGRGYCIVERGDRVIRSIGELLPGDRIAIRMAGGRAGARVEDVVHDGEIRRPNEGD